MVDKSIISLALTVLVLILEKGTPLSSAAPSKRRASPPRKAKAWRYNRPKASKWDVRHTKSLRFEIRAPSRYGKSLSEKKSSWDVLPLHKKPRESLSHVIGKGLIWSLFKDQYGSQPSQLILVESPIPEEPRFVPDVVAFHNESLSISKSDRKQEEIKPMLAGMQPKFWGESGRMSSEKAAALAAKYPHTHFVHLRWGSQVTMDIFEEIENAVLPTLHHRTAPFQFALIQEEPKQFLGEDGTVRLRAEDVQWRTAAFTIDINY